MIKRILTILTILCVACGAALAEPATGGVASQEEMTDVIDIARDGLEPVTADMLNDGVYEVDVDASSSMFKVTGCALTVDAGALTAKLYMKSEAYRYMFSGTAEEASVAGQDALLPLETDGRGHFFTLPVEALDAPYICAAFSARKKVWYPRTLLFRSDSLPLNAWKSERLMTAASLGLQNGRYLCDVTLNGAGKATIGSPAVVTVADGACTARIVFSTKKIDYILVGEDQYFPVDAESGAAFDIPVAAFGKPVAVKVDSTAIKPAALVEYSVVFSPPAGEEAPADTARAYAGEDLDCAPDRFSFSGGSGRVTITCPGVRTEDGETTAEIVFSSPNYTTARIGDETFTGAVAESEGTTTFTLPVPLNQAFSLFATTTAMSQPHEIEYTLFIGMGDEELPTLAWQGRMALGHATGFEVDYYDGGYALIDVSGEEKYLLVPEGKAVPEGLDPEITALRQPLDRVYLTATSAMSHFDALDALDAIALSGTRQDGWTLESAAGAMARGDIQFAGKYSEPDFELLIQSHCDLAIESMMIFHSPQVKELIELLGIPVFVDRSSSEAHPLGRVEWIRLYGLLLGKEAQAEAVYRRQAEIVEALSDAPATGKTVAFFALKSDGSVTVRGTEDYIVKSIELAGGEYAFDVMGGQEMNAAVNITMEAFYQAAAEADFLIYNASIEAPVTQIDELIRAQPLLADFRAVREGRVFCTTRSLYQATDGIGTFIGDLRDMLSGRTDGMTYLYALHG